jgi:6-phosphogluconolactonase
LRPAEVLADPEALAERVAAWLLDLALAKSGTFAVALSGGATPRRLYEVLAAPPYLEPTPWARMHWFWGDERFVPAADPRNNARMAREAMLSHAPIPPENIHAVATEGVNLKTAVLAYENELKRVYGAARFDPARPLFDVALLGLGLDGHTAPLFPGGVALAETRKWVLAVTDAGGPPRITLTFPTLESSRQTAFLVAGAAKHPILDRLRQGATGLPAVRLRPVGGLHKFADRAAAGAA